METKAAEATIRIVSIPQSRSPLKRFKPKDKGALQICEKIKIDRALVSQLSPVIAELLSVGKGAAHNEAEIALKEDSREACRDLLNFMKDGRFRLTKKEDLYKVLVLAGQYKVQTAVDHIADKLIPLTNIAEVNELLHFVDVNNLAIDKSRCSQFLEAKFHNFDATWDTEDFINLNAHSLELLLMADNWQVDIENTVFQAVAKWIRERSKRKSYWPRLSQHIRFHFMSPDYLEYVTFYPKNLFGDADKVVEKKVQEAREYQSAHGAETEDIIKKYNLSPNARPRNNPEYLLVVEDPIVTQEGHEAAKMKPQMNFYGYEFGFDFLVDYTSRHFDFRMLVRGPKAKKANVRFAVKIYAQNNVTENEELIKSVTFEITDKKIRGRKDIFCHHNALKFIKGWSSHNHSDVFRIEVRPTLIPSDRPGSASSL